MPFGFALPRFELELRQENLLEVAAERTAQAERPAGPSSAAAKLPRYWPSV